MTTAPWTNKKSTRRNNRAGRGFVSVLLLCLLVLFITILNCRVPKDTVRKFVDVVVVVADVRKIKETKRSN